MSEHLSTEQRSSDTVVEEVFNYKLKLLQIEYEQLEQTIRSVEDRTFVIRGWGLTAWVGLVAFAAQTQQRSVLWLAFGSTLLFWLLDIFFTSNRIVYMITAREIEGFLNSDALREAFDARSLHRFPTPQLGVVWSEEFLRTHRKRIMVNTLLKHPPVHLPDLGAAIGTIIALRLL